IPADILLQIGNALAEQRAATAADLEHTIANLRDLYRASLLPSAALVTKAEADSTANALQPAPLATAIMARSRPPVGTIEEAIGWAAANRPDDFSALQKLTEHWAPAPLAYSDVE